MRVRGFTVVELVLVLAIAAAIVTISLPNFVRSQQHSYEAGALGSLRAIATKEVLFRDADSEHDGNNDYGMLSELSNTGLIDVALGSGTKRGYDFAATYSVTTSDFLWFGMASPTVPGPAGTGTRWFAINTAGVMYYRADHAFAYDNTTCALPQKTDSGELTGPQWAG